MMMNRIISGLLSLFIMAGSLIALVPFDNWPFVTCIPGILGYIYLMIELM